MAPTDMSAAVEDRKSPYPLRDTAITFTVLNTVMLVLFMTSRFRSKSNLGLEVVFMPLAYFFSMTVIVANFVLIRFVRIGTHVEVLEMEDPIQVVNWFKITMCTQFLYPFAITFPKLAILWLYKKIFQKLWFIRCSYVLIAIVVATPIALTLTSALICRPFAFNWDHTIPGGRCGNLKLEFLIASIPNIVTDIFILVLPLPIIWKLHTSTAEKIGLTITFLTGSLGITTAIVRLYYFATISLFTDPTYWTVTLETWTIIEPGVYFIAAGMPFLRSLIRQFVNSPLVKSLQSYMTFASKNLSQEAKSSILTTKELPPRKTYTQIDQYHASKSNQYHAYSMSTLAGTADESLSAISHSGSK